MNDSQPGSACSDASLDEVLESFLARVRRGDRPSLEDFADSHPEHREEIRELFPALMVLEDRQAGDVPPAGRESSSDDGRLPAPVRLGEYRILREIGHGGMGVVYEAVQETLGRHVALKVLPPQALLSPGYVERFRREAQAAARLHHTNIVPVYGVGQADGVNFYAMQFIEGRGLNQVIEEVRAARTGERPSPDSPTATYAHDERTILIPDHNGDSPAAASVFNGNEINVSLHSGSTAGRQHSQTEWSALPDAQYFRRVAEMGMQVAEALEHAHSQGILHRDVKPANLLLDADGRAWVTDFGLAKLEGADDLTHSGDIVGTIRYMAPERFQGCSDPRSDVYGLGLTLYELLTLRPAFDQEDRLRLIEQILHEDPPRPRTLQRQIPRDLETIVLKAIAREPATRYATAADLAEDLRRYLADRPIQARRSGPLERLWRWCRRNPALAASASLTFLALVAVTAVSAILAIRENLNSNRLIGEQARTSRALRETQRNAAQMALIQAQSLGEVGEAGQAMSWFARSIDLSVRAESPDVEQAARLNLAFWAPHCAQLELMLPHARTPAVPNADLMSPLVVSAMFSPDGRTILTAADRSVRIWDSATGRQNSAIEHPKRVWRLAVSPDGRRLATLYGESQYELRLWDLATRQPIGPPRPHRGYPSFLVFSPDSRTLLSGATAEAARLWDADTGQLVGETPHKGVKAGIFGADGKSVFTGSLNGTVRMWNLAGAEPLSPELKHSAGTIVLAVRPDGGAILTASSGEKGARLWDTATWQSRPLSEPLPVRSAEFSADSRLAVTANGREVAIWDALDGTVRMNFAHTGDVAFATLSPDGRSLLTRSDDGLARLWDTVRVRPPAAPMYHRGNVTSGEFGPDGLRLITGSRDGAARVWRTPAGLEATPPLMHAGMIIGMSFRSDGEVLLTSCSDRTVRLWDVKSGRPIGQPHRHNANPLRPVFSSDGKQFLTGTEKPRSGTADSELLLWDSEGVSPARSIPLTGVELRSFDFTRDGKRFLTAGLKGPIQLWKTDTAQPVGKPIDPKQHLWDVSLSPTGKFILTVAQVRTSGQVMLWDADSGRLLGQLGTAAKPQGATFSPDGRTVLIGSDDGRARRWETSTRRQIGPDILHGASIMSVLFKPDGRAILTTGADRTARLWDAATAEPLCHPLRHDGQIAYATFSPDGRLIMTRTHDYKIRFWDTATGVRLGPPLWLSFSNVCQPVFSPDRALLAVALADNTVRLWQLPSPVQGSPERVRQMVETTSGMRLDDDSAIHVLDAAAWQESRERLTSLGGTTASTDFNQARGAGMDTLAWHNSVARWCEQFNHWIGAEWHLNRLTIAEPDNSEFHSRRGNACFHLQHWDEALAEYSRAAALEPDSAGSWSSRGRCLAMLGRWAEAADDFDRALNRQPDNPWPLYIQAALRLHAGRFDEYRRLCASAEQRFSQKHQDPQAQLLARVCLLSPQAEVDPAAALRLAQQAARADPKSGVYLHTLGLAHYRTGRYDLALQSLQKSSDTKWPGEVLNQLVRAMALQQSSRSEEARRTLDEAVQAIEAAARRRPAGVAGGFPPLIDDWLACYVLRGEAESLIGR